MGGGAEVHRGAASLTRLSQFRGPFGLCQLRASFIALYSPNHQSLETRAAQNPCFETQP